LPFLSAFLSANLQHLFDRFTHVKSTSFGLYFLFDQPLPIYKRDLAAVCSAYRLTGASSFGKSQKIQIAFNIQQPTTTFRTPAFSFSTDLKA
jgi:hypothetical protein